MRRGGDHAGSAGREGKKGNWGSSAVAGVVRDEDCGGWSMGEVWTGDKGRGNGFRASLGRVRGVRLWKLDCVVVQPLDGREMLYSKYLPCAGIPELGHTPVVGSVLSSAGLEMSMAGWDGTIRAIVIGAGPLTSLSFVVLTALVVGRRIEP